MQPLFPIFAPKGDQNTTTNNKSSDSQFSWLKIGATKQTTDSNPQASKQAANDQIQSQQQSADTNRLEKNITEIVPRKPIYNDDSEDKESRRARKKEKKKMKKDKLKKEKEKLELDFKLKDEVIQM